MVKKKKYIYIYIHIYIYIYTYTYIYTHTYIYTPANEGDMGLIPGWKDPLEKKMATHISILAWNIPWTEQPGGLQSMGLQKESGMTKQLNMPAHT